VSTKNWNHEVVDNVFWKGDKSMPKSVCAKRRVDSFLVQGKVCSQIFSVDSSNLAQGDLGDVCQQKAHVFGGLCQTSKN
jgi:hypothetical protein